MLDAMCLIGQKIVYREKTLDAPRKHDVYPLSAYPQKHAGFDPRLHCLTTSGNSNVTRPFIRHTETGDIRRQRSRKLPVCQCRA